MLVRCNPFYSCFLEGIKNQNSHVLELCRDVFGVLLSSPCFGKVCTTLFVLLAMVESSCVTMPVDN